MKEEDVATYTMKTMDDPGTLNQSLYIMPHINIFSENKFVGLWERIIGKTQEKVYVSNDVL